LHTLRDGEESAVINQVDSYMFFGRGQNGIHVPGGVNIYFIYEEKFFRGRGWYLIVVNCQDY